MTVAEKGREITHLKLQLGGAKGRMKQLSERIEELNKQVEHYKKLDLEGDGLYEKSLEKIELLQEAITWYNDLPWYKKIFVRKIF